MAWDAVPEKSWSIKLRRLSSTATVLAARDSGITLGSRTSGSGQPECADGRCRPGQSTSSSDSLSNFKFRALDDLARRPSRPAAVRYLQFRFALFEVFFASRVPISYASISYFCALMNSLSIKNSVRFDFCMQETFH